MDTSGSIRLTSDFLSSMNKDIRECIQNTNALLAGRKITGKLLERSLRSIALNPGTFCYNLHKQGTKQFMFAVVLQNGDFNPRMGYKERLVSGTVQYFGKKHSIGERLSFTISHHCFQRILERLDVGSIYHDVPTELFSKRTLTRQDSIFLRKIFFEQMDYLPIISSTLFYLELLISMVEIGEQNISVNAVFEFMTDVTLPIPTPHGVLLGSIHKSHLHVKTFVPDDMLTTTQLELKEKMIALFEPFRRSKLIYFPACRDISSRKEIILITMLLHALAIKMQEVIEDETYNLTKAQSEENKTKLKTLFRFNRLQADKDKHQHMVMSEFRKLWDEHGTEKTFKLLEKQVAKSLIITRNQDT